VDRWIWVLIVGAIALVAVLMLRRRPNLKERFGPEYDRAVEETDSERAARHQLRDRLKQHRKLDLRPLAPDAARAYAERWFVVQSRFVDDPAGTCREAGDLLDQVLRDRGYPVDEDFDTQADLVSVDHPNLVSDYRTANEATTRGTSGDAGTEDLRVAFVAYRNLFTDVLDQQDADARDDAGEIDLTTPDGERDVDDASVDADTTVDEVDVQRT
jgi:hypothetical protein